MVGMPLTKNYIYDTVKKDVENTHRNKIIENEGFTIAYILTMLLFPILAMVSFRYILLRRARSVVHIKLQREKEGESRSIFGGSNEVSRGNIKGRRARYQDESVQLKIEHKYCEDLVKAFKFWDNSFLV